MKIFILGAAGTGKTTLATRISKKTHIEATNLDDIFWSNEKDSFGVKRDKTERDMLYEAILQKESWIIEGAYVEWPKQGFYRADEVVYLDVGRFEINKRIIRRFVLRKLHFEASIKTETISGLINLIKWNNKQIVEMKLLMDKLKLEGLKIIELYNSMDVEKYVESI